MSAAMSIPKAPEPSPVVRIRGYTIAECMRAVRAREELEASIDVLARAREAAEEALAKCRAACDHAEEMSIFAARVMSGDVDAETLESAAEAIAALVGQ